MTVFAADINTEAVIVFAIVLSITLGITYWASKRARSAVGFYAAGRQITGPQNGLAISGDYLSAASFLGIAGLIFIYGFDGFLYSIGFLVAFLTVMFLLAERMRNAGKFTIADVLSCRLNEAPARTAAAMGTLSVAAFYLIAQMVGAGVLIQALVGIDFALVVGTAGLPHILMRFFTVPNARAARGSVVWAMFLIGFFYLLTTAIGFGARAILGQGGVEAAGKGGNLAAPNLAQELGGGEGTFGGDVFLAIIAGVAFATILAVVAGLVLAASSAVAHDVWSSIIRKHHDSEHEEVWVAKIAAASIGAIAIIIAVVGGEALNVSFMVGLAFAIAASANFPALVLALTWRRFNTTGAVCGVLSGVISAIGLIIISPIVWGGAPGAPDTGAFTW